jgi:hypothetical protein
MSNSLIMMTSANTNSVLENGLIPLTTITRRRGQVINSSNNGIVLNRVGYYKINANITFTAPEAGIVSVALQKNNLNLQGITSSTSITTATTEVRSLALSGIIRIGCCEAPATLTLINNGVAIDTSNVEIDVEYLG